MVPLSFMNRFNVVVQRMFGFELSLTRFAFPTFFAFVGKRYVAVQNIFRLEGFMTEMTFIRFSLVNLKIELVSC